MAAIDPTRIRNLLLRALPPRDLEALLPHLHCMELAYRAVLHRPGEPLMAVHFPESGYVSMLALFEGGDASEVGMVGHEGMTGLPLLLGSDRTPMEALVQSGGTALRMEAGLFRRAVEGMPPLRRVLLRYALAYQVQISMTAACNGRHAIGQRMARWMLMADDRTGGEGFPMTHEFLSTMLGVRRAGITVAAGGLRKAGLIQYEQGQMQVIDRAGLEAAACSCHRIARREFERLFPAEKRQPVARRNDAMLECAPLGRPI